MEHGKDFSNIIDGAIHIPVFGLNGVDPSGFFKVIAKAFEPNYAGGWIVVIVVN